MWFHDASVYHLFPLGALDAAEQPRGFHLLRAWAPYIADSGYTAVLLGPIWHSATHGYDTVDYRNPDPRLGTWEDLEAGVSALREAGLRIVLDTVFNHSGRGFFAFADVCNRGSSSPYWSWYRGLRMEASSPGGIAVSGWNGYAELPQFDLTNTAVRRYHLETLDLWMSRLDFDGLRLDAADVMDPAFLRELAAHCRAGRPDIWLLGEIVNGDYGSWLRDSTFDSVTNYELYKSLWSSHRDGNYYELAWTEKIRRWVGEAALEDLLNDGEGMRRIAPRQPIVLFPRWARVFRRVSG